MSRDWSSLWLFDDLRLILFFFIELFQRFFDEKRSDWSSRTLGLRLLKFRLLCLDLLELVLRNLLNNWNTLLLLLLLLLLLTLLSDFDRNQLDRLLLLDRDSYERLLSRSIHVFGLGMSRRLGNRRAGERPPKLFLNGNRTEDRRFSRRSWRLGNRARDGSNWF